MKRKSTALLKNMVILGINVINALGSRTLLTLSLLFLFPFLIHPAYSSTNAAWNAGDAAAQTACKNASQLKDVKAVGAITHFDDSVGYSVLLQEGIYPQKHMKSKLGQEMCLYKRNSRQAAVTEVAWE